MRRAILVSCLAAFLAVPSAAPAQGGSAQCTGPAQVGKTQAPGGLALEVGAYTGRAASLDGGPFVKDLEPGPVEIAAAEAEETPE